MSEQEIAELQEAAWFNFEIIQAFDNWLISKGGLVLEHTEEKDGPTAVALNWIASIEAMLKKDNQC